MFQSLLLVSVCCGRVMPRSLDKVTPGSMEPSAPFPNPHPTPPGSLQLSVPEPPAWAGSSLWSSCRMKGWAVRPHGLEGN